MFVAGSSAYAYATKPSTILAKTNIKLRRVRRLRVFVGLSSAGASHHHKPLQMMKTIPLDTRRSSILAPPWLFGKKGRSRATCSSFSQKSLLILPSAVQLCESRRQGASRPINGL